MVGLDKPLARIWVSSLTCGGAQNKRFVPTNLLALHRAVQKPAPTPHGTSARFAAIHQLVSSFRVRASDPAGARITSISGPPRRGEGGSAAMAGLPLKASPLRLRQALAAHGRGHRRGPLRCPI